MADIPINNVQRRVQFTGNTTTGPFAFTFNILADADIVAYKNTTLLSLGSDYTVSTNANGTGSITLASALVASDVLTIIGARALERTTDFVTAGDLLASSLNEQLDSIVIMAQQLDEKMDRAMKVAIGDVFGDLEIPSKAARLGTVLGFNATTGNPEAGPKIADVGTIANIKNDVATLADIEDGTIATDAISGLAAVKTNVVNVDANKTNINTVAANNANVTTVAGINANVTTVAGISSNVTTVAGINQTHLASVATSISTLNALSAMFAVADNITVTVVNDGVNKFAFNGITAPAITLVQGFTYTFDVSDSSVSGHPLAFKDSGGSAFTTGVTVNGTAGSAGANVVIVVPTTGTMPARYYCTSHGNGMGNTIATQIDTISLVANNSTNIDTVANNISTIAQKATVDEATALAIALGG